MKNRASCEEMNIMLVHFVPFNLLLHTSTQTEMYDFLKYYEKWNIIISKLLKCKKNILWKKFENLDLFIENDAMF